MMMIFQDNFASKLSYGSAAAVSVRLQTTVSSSNYNVQDGTLLVNGEMMRIIYKLIYAVM